jgi:hypothetical protein
MHLVSGAGVLQDELAYKGEGADNMEWLIQHSDLQFLSELNSTLQCQVSLESPENLTLSLILHH